ncbi:MAG: PD-(D/E)XK nuclease family protein, partial [Bacteroides sp.]|nr:PD-(D/E)XK nuclease family protein [Bacteroides sp.]
MENSFLKLVSHDLYCKYGTDLSHIAVVFPNKRASLFFNEYLSYESDLPVWSPAYYTINDLVEEISPLEAGDPIKLVCELYKVFMEETNSEESLDEFYFWGELLIRDFDDLDKNLVEADKLFLNLQNLKELSTDYSFLDPDQEKAIQQFFQNFSVERRTTLKERFLSLWEKLGDIYQKYKERLDKQNIAYEGMLYRTAIEELDVSELPYETYVFVGFNVLNKVKNLLFRKLKDAKMALFYWDYDNFYMDKEHHEASEFIRRNLLEFPSTLPKKAFSFLEKKKKVTYVSASTENAQARYLSQWIKEHLTEKEEETGVVLCNENLLLPVLHTIPEQVKNLNITIGFPLVQTPVHSFINALLDLQITGYRPDSGRFIYKYVSSVLKHAYTRQFSTETELLEQHLTSNNRFYPYPTELKKDEFLGRIFTPQSGNLQICDYLIDILQLVAGYYRETGDK